MNVIFFDYRYVQGEMWKFLAEALKISRIFSFVKFEAFSEESRRVLSCLNIRSIPDNNYAEFANQCVYQIVYPIKSISYSIDHTPINITDNNIYQDSRWCAPAFNIKNTNDENYLILGEIKREYRKKSFFCYYVNEWRDLALDISLHTLNILRNQLDTDIYRQRLCFYMIDLVRYNEYIKFKKDWHNIDDLYRKSRSRCTAPKLMHYINRTLRDSYPNLFPEIIVDCKHKFTPFWDEEFIKEEKKQYNVLSRRICIEEANSFRQDMIDARTQQMDEEDGEYYRSQLIIGGIWDSDD